MTASDQQADATGGCVATIGPVGAAARALVGAALLTVALLVRDPAWPDVALGLVAMPAIVLAVLAVRARGRPQDLRATGPMAHVINILVAVALLAQPATAGGALLFYGTTMLFAAVRRQGGCEVTVIANAVLRRDDQVGCPVFGPVDAFEASRGGAVAGQAASR